MSDPILELLAAPPAPSMSVDEDVIRLAGRRRLRRRQLIRGSGTGLAMVAAAATLWVALPHVTDRLVSAATSAPRTEDVSALNEKVAAIASSPTAVPLTLPDGTGVWVDAHALSAKGHMFMAARAADGLALGTGSKPTQPVGAPYNVPLDWSRSLLPDRLLVWGVGLEGTTRFRPDLNSGAVVASTTTAVIPGSHSMVYVIDVRAPDGKAPSSIAVVSGLAMQGPTNWPPKP